MNKTLIPWVKNPDGTQGYTWNPVTGCLNHTNGLCNGGGFPCYAYRLANTRLRERYLPNQEIVNPIIHVKDFHKGYSPYNDPFYPRFWEERIRELDPTWKGKHFIIGGASKVQPKGIFVCDMSDLFGIGIPEEWTREVLNICRMNMGHRFYLLTKQPQNLPEWGPFPDNCWVGVTATNKDGYFKAIHWADEYQASVKYVSFEPIPENPLVHPCDLIGVGINWLIIGACTGTRKDMQALIQRYPDSTLMPFGKKWSAQPKIEWVQEIVEAADKAGIPVFLKDNLKPLIFKLPILPIEGAVNWAGGLRQEIPEGKEGK